MIIGGKEEEEGGWCRLALYALHVSCLTRFPWIERFIDHNLLFFSYQKKERSHCLYRSFLSLYTNTEMFIEFDLLVAMSEFDSTFLKAGWSHDTPLYRPI